jgi:ADP-ribose pyrophosphatase
MEYLTTKEPANGLFDSVHHYFVARGCEPTGEQELDFNESIRVGVAPFDELMELALADALPDGRSAIGLYHYALQHR